MELSSRVKAVGDSVTLKLNEKATILQEEGKQVYNLTAGQLPFKPPKAFMDCIGGELNLLKSYQYAPVPGFVDLRQKQIAYFLKSRELDISDVDMKLDCVVSNGGKHSVYNTLGCLINPGDEVALIAPYWVSYPEMIKFWGGKMCVVKGHTYDAYIPSMEDIKSAISEKTKVIIVNSPNNPAGIHYPKKWMEEFAQLLEEYPQLLVISDEIYYEVAYFDPKPTYFYQENPELLKRTIIIDGISKKLACTGLRIGFTMGPSHFTKAYGKLQAQTTSGANSLIQRALIDFDFGNINTFLAPARTHLRKNAALLQEKFRDAGLAKCWYQTLSAFYFMIDFSRTPLFEKYSKGEASGDYSSQIAEDLLVKTGVAVVPGTDFGMPNSARFSLVLDEIPFDEAVSRMTLFFTDQLD